ncbi:MAG: hypothetical protein HOM58_23170 [Rhodospirillaceae bacterium]|nr:hypothetical protein [Rhodospirillaceae bacterium]MBT7756308.1 hypothetical protein [Rhodospirillaceae bacterium]
MKGLSVAAALTGLLALTGFGAYRTWTELEDVAISINGWIALGLGALATLVLGAGLMFLVFYSNRHGYDDNDRP